MPVKAITPNVMESDYDSVLLLIKRLANKEIVTFLKNYFAEDGVICLESRKCNVKTPINNRIVEIVKRIETSEVQTENKSISLFGNQV